MTLPYVIDNTSGKRLSDILSGLLSTHVGRSLDIATAYFTVGAFQVLQPGLEGLGNFRLLLGAEPSTGNDLGLRPQEHRVKGLLTQDLSALPFSEANLRLIEDLISFLRRERVAVRLVEKGFLHAKAYLFYLDQPQTGWDRLQPMAGIVGSSNFTFPGLTSNRELNLTHKVLLSDAEVDSELDRTGWLSSGLGRELDIPDRIEKREAYRKAMSSVGARAIKELDDWYEARWNESRDFKQDLIDLLDASKFGEKEYPAAPQPARGEPGAGPGGH